MNIDHLNSSTASTQLPTARSPSHRWLLGHHHTAADYSVTITHLLTARSPHSSWLLGHNHTADCSVTTQQLTTRSPITVTQLTARSPSHSCWLLGHHHTANCSVTITQLLTARSPSHRWLLGHHHTTADYSVIITQLLTVRSPPHGCWLLGHDHCWGGFDVCQDDQFMENVQDMELLVYHVQHFNNVHINGSWYLFRFDHVKLVCHHHDHIVLKTFRYQHFWVYSV